MESNDDVDNYLCHLFGSSTTPNDPAANNFQKQLKACETELHQTHTYNVWNHWVARKFSHPELYSVAMVILAIPSTQVTVERAFSALAIVLSDLRTGLGEDTLANILLIKLNADIAENVLPDLYSWNDVPGFND